MSAGPLIIEVISLFFVVLYLLNKYSDIRQHNKFTLVATFIAWYFSFMIIILLPMDISLTTYRQCEKEHKPSNYSSNSTNSSEVEIFCKTPLSLISQSVFPVIWRIIYWSSQALTWIILPFMQSFSQSGEFSLTGKLKNAFYYNAIYYGTYLAIFGFLLVYVAIKITIDGQKLKVIGITASNTWGLFLLVLLLGYGLVAVPRSIWHKSNTALHLKQTYFKMAKLHSEKCEAEENLEDILGEIKVIAEKVKYNHPLRPCIDIIVTKCPQSFRNNLRRNIEDYTDFSEDDSNSNSRRINNEIPSEKSLVKLHSRLIKSLQVNTRTINQWQFMIAESFHMEDIFVNEKNSNMTFTTTSPIVKEKSVLTRFCSSRLEWFYYCLLKKYFLKLLSITLALITLMVVWSEMTFFNKKPVLSIFAILLSGARHNYNYMLIEICGCFVIAYLSFCAYYAIFKMRVFNYYYLAPNHQTNEYSLVFSGTLICRLTSPLCYNFLGLVHLDSHITKDENVIETEFTRIMGHMDVISFISDGFNIYFPILIFILCLATFFNFGGYILHYFGFEQFIGDVEITNDLIEDGKNLVKREKRRIQQNDPEVQLRHRDLVSRLKNNYSTNSMGRSPNSSGLLTSETEASSSLNTNQEDTSSSSKYNFLSKASFDSYKNKLSSTLPSFLSRKTNFSVKEYRDIPPYTDDINAERSDDSDLLTRNNDSSNSRLRFNEPNDYESTNRNSGDRTKKPNIRGIFDDI